MGDQVRPSGDAISELWLELGSFDFTERCLQIAGATKLLLKNLDSLALDCVEGLPRRPSTRSEPASWIKLRGNAELAGPRPSS
jgi:hypothetical protein